MHDKLQCRHLMNFGIRIPINMQMTENNRIKTTLKRLHLKKTILFEILKSKRTSIYLLKIQTTVTDIYLTKYLNFIFHYF